MYDLAVLRIPAAGGGEVNKPACGTMLAGVDVSTSEIGGWTLTDGAPELRGLTVTPVQAVELAERLGLIVAKQQGENEGL